MTGELGLLIIVATFGLVALASHQLGRYMARIRLPLITGFLACGILAGPHVLGLISEGAPEKLRFLDQICLGFIALAAGNELNYRELRSRGKVGAGLGVDADSLTGANRIYERAGMRVELCEDAFEKEMRPGVDLRIRSLTAEPALGQDGAG